MVVKNNIYGIKTDMHLSNLNMIIYLFNCHLLISYLALLVAPMGWQEKTNYMHIN